MIKKLLASEVIEIDDKFLEIIEARLKERSDLQRLSKVYTVEEVAEMAKSSEATIRRHIKNELLKAAKVGKSWIISQENYDNYMKGNIE